MATWTNNSSHQVKIVSLNWKLNVSNNEGIYLETSRKLLVGDNLRRLGMDSYNMFGKINTFITRFSLTCYNNNYFFLVNMESQNNIIFRKRKIKPIQTINAIQLENVLNYRITDSVSHVSGILLGVHAKHGKKPKDNSQGKPSRGNLIKVSVYAT